MTRPKTCASILALASVVWLNGDLVLIADAALQSPGELVAKLPQLL